MADDKENYGNEQRRAGPVKSKLPVNMQQAVDEANDAKTRALEDKAIKDSKQPYEPEFLKGVVRKASGGSIRGGGCETKGQTKGRMV